MITQREIVEKDFYEMLERVAEKFRINSSEYKKPIVVICADDVSNFDWLYPNRVSVHPEDINDRRVHVEESTHYLRYHISNGKDYFVHQFFGGLASLLLSDVKDIIPYTKDEIRKAQTEFRENENALEAHEKISTRLGYTIAQMFHDHGFIDYFLNKYLDIIRKPDAKVRKIIFSHFK